MNFINKHILKTATCNYRVEKVATYYNEINQFQSLTQKIRPQHETTLMRLIKQYGKKLDSFFKSSNRYHNPMDHPEALMMAEQLWYYAKCCRVPKRTLERHLDRLEEAGLIIKRRKYARVRIYFNPILLSFNDEKKYNQIYAKLSTIFLEEEQKKQEIEHSKNQSVSKSKTTNCRIMYISGNIIKVLNTFVDKDKSVLSSVVDSEVKPNFLEQKEITENRLTIAKSRAKIESEKAAARRNKKLKKCAGRIWRFAYEELYGPQLGKQLDFLSITQEEFAVKFFYEDLNRYPDRELNKAMNDHLYRLRQWRNWINKPKVNGFTPLPTKFLDPKFQNGYGVTLKWQWNNHKTSHYHALANRVSDVIRKIQQYYFYNKSFDEINTLRVESTRRINAMLAKESRRHQRLVNDDQIKFLLNQYQVKVNEVIKQY